MGKEWEQCAKHVHERRRSMRNTERSISNWQLEEVVREEATAAAKRLGETSGERKGRQTKAGFPVRLRARRSFEAYVVALWPCFVSSAEHETQRSWSRATWMGSIEESKEG